MSADSTMNKTDKAVKAKHDWAAFDAMTEKERLAAALSDPDAQPLTPAGLKLLVLQPRAFIIRRALKLTQEEFAECFRIPLGTLRDWEQGKTEPDAAARAYLLVIARDPKAVLRAFKMENA